MKRVLKLTFGAPVRANTELGARPKPLSCDIRAGANTRHRVTDGSSLSENNEVRVCGVTGGQKM